MPHDGHEIITRHYLAAFQQLGWIDGKIQTKEWPQPALNYPFSEARQHALKDAVEVVVLANRYFTEIDDHRMKSIRLLTAEIL